MGKGATVDAEDFEEEGTEDTEGAAEAITAEAVVVVAADTGAADETTTAVHPVVTERVAEGKAVLDDSRCGLSVLAPPTVCNRY